MVSWGWRGKSMDLLHFWLKNVPFCEIFKTLYFFARRIFLMRFFFKLYSSPRAVDCAWFWVEISGPGYHPVEMKVPKGVGVIFWKNTIFAKIKRSKWPGTTAAAGCSLLINPKLIRLWDVSAPPEWKHTTLVPARGCEDYNYVDVSWYDWINPYPWDTPLREFFISDLGFWPIWVGGLRIPLCSTSYSGGGVLEDMGW